jgi:hypothetical protein
MSCGDQPEPESVRLRTRAGWKAASAERKFGAHGKPDDVRRRVTLVVEEVEEVGKERAAVQAGSAGRPLSPWPRMSGARIVCVSARRWAAPIFHQLFAEETNP